MGIRAKLLLPLIALVLVIFAAVEFYLLPNLAERERAQQISNHQIQLEVLEIALVEPLLNSNLSQMHLMLDAVVAKNVELKLLQLHSANNERLYPIEKVEEIFENENLVRYQNAITYLDDTIATLSVMLDLHGYLKDFEKQVRIIYWIVLLLLPMAVLASALLQDRLVRNPLSKLASAATRIANGDFVVDLPKAGNDEVGQLVQAFSHMCQMRNIAESALEELAYYDVLTKLPNRAMLKARLVEAIELAGKKSQTLSLLFIDLDRFKMVNDTLGHDVGDLLLIEAASRIKNTVCDNDIVARLGGDEFTVVLQEDENGPVTSGTAEKIIEALALPFDFGGYKSVISPSIGISVFPEDATDCGSMLRCADTAMYQAKESGGNRYTYYCADMGDKLSHSMNIEAGLRRALENEEFILHYQPKVELGRGKIVGVEALVRWMDPINGMIPPNDFIPLAEDTGLIIPLSAWVLQEACEQLVRWGIADLDLAINISASHLRHPELLPLLRDTLENTGCSPDRLEIEITENTIMQNVQQVTGLLEDINALGVKIAIDDFGTGYSSLGYLKRFAFDTIKIDRSFIKEIPGDSDDVAITTATIQLARSLKRELVAEGIETEEQALFLKNLGCQLAQGYYFSKPVAADEFLSLITKSRYLPARPKMQLVVNN